MLSGNGCHLIIQRHEEAKTKHNVKHIEQVDISLSAMKMLVHMIFTFQIRKKQS